MACVVLGAAEREKFDAGREAFGETVCKHYDAAEVLHDGKWLDFNVHDDSFVEDIIRLLHIKRKPNRKILPKSLEDCFNLDIGLTHQEITNAITPPQ